MKYDKHNKETEISFAIAYEFNAKMLELNYGGSYAAAADEFESHLREWGFDNKQGTVVYGGNNVTTVESVVAMIEASKKFKWLSPSLEYVRLFQLLNNDDLRPALGPG